jgi:hypothetical protein
MTHANLGFQCSFLLLLLVRGISPNLSVNFSFMQGWETTTSVLGILFQSMFFISIGAMLKIPPQFAARGIVYKHQGMVVLVSVVFFRFSS